MSTWPIDEKLLASIYDLSHYEVPVVRDKKSCAKFSHLLADFCEEMVDTKSSSWMGNTGLAALAYCTLVLRDADNKISWFPQYGCALLEEHGAGCIARTVALNTIGLDAYHFEMHGFRGSNKHNHTSYANDYEILHIGTSTQETVKIFHKKFSRLLDKASSRKGDHRSAADGRQGHQRTPAFIHALQRQAFLCRCPKSCCSCPPQVPRGGFSDVGLHTGGAGRDTAWPLVRSIFQYALVQFARNAENRCLLDPVLFYRKSIVQFDLYIAERLVGFLNSKGINTDTSGAPGVFLDTVHCILCSAAIRGSTLSDEGHDMMQFHERLSHLKDQLEVLALAQAEKYGEGFSLPALDPGYWDNYGSRGPELKIPPLVVASLSKPSINERKRWIKINIGGFSLLHPSKKIADVFTWLEQPGMDPAQSSAAALYTLRSIEDFLWDCARNNLTKLYFNEEDLPLLAKVVDHYRSIKHDLQTKKEYGALMHVEVQSRELLVIWVAFCLMHSAAFHVHGAVMHGFGVPLDFKDLRHLVLSDRKASDTVLIVADYLRPFSTAQAIFSLRLEDATFELGERYARAHLLTVWKQEKEDASIRVKRHWEEVLRKQKLAQKIRNELANIREEKASADIDLAKARAEQSQHQIHYQKSRRRYATAAEVRQYNATAHTTCDTQVNRLSQKVTMLASQITTKKRELKDAEKAPEAVYQPLPSGEPAALSVLFFLRMPLTFQLLARFSFTSQQMLLPRPWVSKCGGDDGNEEVNVFSHVSQARQCQYSWTNYYNSHQACFYHTPMICRSGKDSDILLRVQANTVPQVVPPEHVDHCTSPSDGVWYPDSLLPRMAWTGGPHHWDQHNADEFDPFRAPSSWSVSYFTELLPVVAEMLQWAMRQPGAESVSPERGNRSIANQHSKPEWLSKVQYLSFCKLRAYPHIQLRNLVTSMDERMLPLSLESVHVIIHQLLFHVGDIGAIDEKSCFEWRKDLDETKSHIAFLDVLREFAEELSNSPKSYACAKIVGEISNFFSAWNRECRAVSRLLASSACKWAEELDCQIDTSPLQQVPLLRSRQVIFYRLALLLLVGGDLNDKDVESVVHVTARAKNLFFDGHNAALINALTTRCNYAMSSQVPHILDVVNRNPKFLTRAVRSVLPRCPKELNWLSWTCPNKKKTPCFEAHGDDGCIYSINVFSGIVLLDGLPPCRLSAEILSHPLYKRTFGDRNFEIIRKEGWSETVRPVHDNYYRFFLHGSRLVIIELKRNNTFQLELLNNATCERWGKELPIRLQKLHSHWLCREGAVVILRGICFNQQEVYYVIRLEDEGHGGVYKSICKCIPHYRQSDDLITLMKTMGSMDSLVVHTSPVIGILAKFESSKYIHVLSTETDGKERIKFEFVRFGLTFEVKEGELVCLEIAGYKLANKQQLTDTLRGFDCYLMLRHIQKEEDQLLLVPCASVITKGSGRTELSFCQDDCASHRTWHQYHVHQRFKYLVAHSITSRLQLAALHFSTSSKLFDRQLGMTGEERAVELIRQCWTTRPLSVGEQEKLNNIKRLCCGVCPVLALLCKDLELSSQRVAFLHTTSTQRQCHLPTDCDEGSAYLQRMKSLPTNPRVLLTESEECRIIGVHARTRPLSRVLESTQELQPCPVSEAEVESIQESIYALLLVSEQRSVSREEFPLRGQSSGLKLEHDMTKELQDSWDAHCNAPRKIILTQNICIYYERYHHVFALRRLVEEYLLRALNTIPEGTRHWHDIGHDLLRIANTVPTASLSDLAKLACSPDRMKEFNPMLSLRAQGYMFTGLVTWLRLCVLEDKLSRLKCLAAMGTERSKDIVSELSTRSTWGAAEHPAWLAFEVEGMLQIRPEQYSVTRHLIENPGDIVQLNMGLGKTRVILPMLAIHWCFGHRDMITRLNFLSPLFMEAYSYLHNHLCASILGIKLYALPFCRDVELDEDKIQTMALIIGECKREGGIFVVAPEHRLSLELKQKELHRANNLLLSSALDGLIRSTPWRDVLDESDELLHHRYQLIYAVGRAAELPGGPHRWRAVQALLFKVAFDKKVQHLLKRSEEIALVLQEPMSEAFPSTRLLKGPLLDSMLPQLRDLLAESVMNDPPYELIWMKNHVFRDQILQAMTVPEKYPAARLAELPEDQRNDVLALRGLLAADVLFHCLLKRHRVNYGVARPGKKRLAVPFHAADTPSERAEFAHPDCALCLTTLAYYSDGLTREELREAVKKLQELGKTAQRTFYAGWFDLSKDRMKKSSPDCFSALDSVEKIDLSNAVQQKNMWKYYHRNMRAVNFFLNTCLFPQETEVKDKRLTSSAWHLANNPQGQIVGFSGTNDNHRILPLQVQQYFVPDDGDPILRELLGTNGKMLEVIINQTEECVELPEGPAFKSLLNLVKARTGGGKKAHAIIDCGALLAGVRNIDFAKSLLDILPIEQFQGVAFFDNSNMSEWMVLEPSGRCLPKHQSPVHERNAFVLFDEPRCRGTDLKLKLDALAVLTLGPNMCKDKLMQAAGRMRQLDRGQRLVIVGGRDVFEQLRGPVPKQNRRAHGQVSTRDVLSWTLKNTVQSTAEGLSNWSNQGLFFSTTVGKPDFAAQDEKLSLAQFYGEPFVNDTVEKAALCTQKYHLGRTGGKAALSEYMANIVCRIEELIVRYGTDFSTSQRGADEECERELELEQELEEEVEPEIPRMCPVPESDWNFSSIFTCSTPHTLPITTYSLSDVMKSRLVPQTLALIKWSADIYCTTNFLETVANSSQVKELCLNKYLRLVDAAIRFPGGEVLLISEREADHLLNLFWEGVTQRQRRNKWNPTQPSFFHHSFARRASDRTSQSLSLVLPPTRELNISDETMASVQLFAGETTYRTASRREALKAMLLARKCHINKVVIAANAEPEHLVEMRGLHHQMSYSDLEKICITVSCEALREYSSDDE